MSTHEISPPARKDQSCRPAVFVVDVFTGGDKSEATAMHSGRSCVEAVAHPKRYCLRWWYR